MALYVCPVAPLAGARIEITVSYVVTLCAQVAPLAGARIEIWLFLKNHLNFSVAPLAGARIEIMGNHIKQESFKSLPSRERGLKFISENLLTCKQCVAPLAGARIEMHHRRPTHCRRPVAPLAGARIEMHPEAGFGLYKVSLPSRERGLKYPGTPVALW